MAESSEWHLDKRVNIALILSLALHLGASIWWASNMTEKMVQVERRLEGFAVRTERTDTEVREQSEEIAILAQRMATTVESVERLRTEISVTNNLLRELLRESR